MRLTFVSLPVRDVRSAAAHYRDILGLPVTRVEESAHVYAGSTRLELREEADVPGIHHLALTIPTGTFPAAKAWVRDRAALLSAPDGQDEFEASPAWNARSVYFEGPEHAVLELIERRDLDHDTAGGFTPADLLGVSEVGIAVPDVRATCRRLQSAAGIGAYGGEPSDSFAAVGDVHGLLILVSPGRAWFPTADRGVAVVPTTVRAVAGRAGAYPLGGLSTLHLVESRTDRDGQAEHDGRAEHGRRAEHGEQDG